MSYEITYSRAVRTQLQRLPGHLKAVAKQQIAALSGNPRPPQAKEFTSHQNYYRLWLGASYRIVWHVLDELQTVEIDYVGPKTTQLYAKLDLARVASEDDENSSSRQ